MELTAKGVLQSAYRDSTNMLTPYITEYGWINSAEKLAYELSYGDPFLSSGFIWGVTVAQRGRGMQGIRRPELSQGGFESEKEARDYVAQLKEQHS